MTVSEFKLENHKPISKETANSVELYDGTFANEGDKLIDAFLVEEDEENFLIHFVPAQISNFEIIEDPEYDIFTPLSEQKFKVKLK